MSLLVRKLCRLRIICTSMAAILAAMACVEISLSATRFEARADAMPPPKWQCKDISDINNVVPRGSKWYRCYCEVNDLYELECEWVEIDGPNGQPIKNRATVWNGGTTFLSVTSAITQNRRSISSFSSHNWWDGYYAPLPAGQVENYMWPQKWNGSSFVDIDFGYSNNWSSDSPHLAYTEYDVPVEQEGYFRGRSDGWVTWDYWTWYGGGSVYSPYTYIYLGY